MFQKLHNRYDSALDADYSPSELSGEDDPLEYDSQTDEPEPRFHILVELSCEKGCAALVICILSVVCGQVC